MSREHRHEELQELRRLRPQPRQHRRSGPLPLGLPGAVRSGAADPPFHNGTLENILPIVDKCVAPGGIVICESETKLVLPVEVGSLQLKKQYKYGKVLLWKYVRPMADAAEEEGEA